MIKTGSDYDLSYTCFLLTEIADITHNSLNTIIQYFDYKRLKGIYNSACVFHCENPESVADKFIQNLGIKQGDFYRDLKRPTSIEMGDVLGRLIFDLKNDNVFNDLIQGILEVLNDKYFITILENPDSTLYWQWSDIICLFYTERNTDWLY